MQLTKEEYYHLLCAMEQLTSKQMNTDINSYRTEVLTVLCEILGFHQSLFWLVDENKLIDPILFNIEEKTLQEYNDYFYQLDYLQPSNLNKKRQVQKLTDVISFSKYIETEYYHSFMKKYSLLDEMGIYLEYQGECVGVIGLLRSKGEQLFVETDRIKLSFLAKQIESSLNIQSVLKLNQQKQSDLLTERERELVNYLEKGLKNKEIAKKLYVSEHTIKKHLQNLYRKFNVSNRTELLYRMK
ncbi:response regulator transcription factor [Bacillus sp. REN10]|uniref:response regulator transcription factor n=1 Tax=Bacillus sp. REN10 TaxID=2782541 RepID=UPI00193C237A|nr:response regulator transcription factor [Bacillus sp. REN10]